MAFHEEDCKVARIEVWPNSGGQGGYISVYAGAMKRGEAGVWLYGDAGVGLDPDTAERLADAIKHAVGIARGEIERGGPIDVKYRADLKRSVTVPPD
jgi:hypothetical protein